MEQTLAIVGTVEDEQLHERMLSWLDSLHDPLIPRDKVANLLNELWTLFLEYRGLEYLRDKNRFAIADRVLELERLAGEVAYQFIDGIAAHFGYPEMLLRQHLRVAQLFPPHVRKPNLRFSYYRMIAEIHLGTKDFAERQARAWQLLEVVAAHAEAGAITSRYDDVKRIVQTELKARGWLTPQLTSKTESDNDIIDASYSVVEQSVRTTPPKQQLATAQDTEPTPLVLSVKNRYVIVFTVLYGVDGQAEHTVVCDGDAAFCKTMETLAAFSEAVAYQNGLLTGLYIDSDDPIPLSLLNQLSPSARALLCAEESL